ncbi:MAG: winged helix-turn-helix domain-containing protein [Candidatus Nezhaarchaeales archaeon]
MIEEILSSKGRVKILKVLIDHAELNISEIVKRSDLNHSTTNAHLKELKKFGIVDEKRFGRVRIFRLKLEDPRVQALKTTFETFKIYEEAAGQRA